MPKDVFICHSSQDKAFADEICALLEARGLSCWIAPRDVRKGYNYDEEIVTGIKGTRVLAVLLSESSEKSRHVKREVEIADQEQNKVFPIRIRNYQPGENLRYYLAGNQRIDVWEKPLKEYGDLMADSVMDLLNSSAPDTGAGQTGKNLRQAKKTWDGKRKWILIAAIIIAIALLLVVLFIPWGGGNVMYIPAHH